MRTALLAALPWLACAKPAEPPACPEHEVEDEVAGECVPEACGTGEWGSLERDGDTIHVATRGDDRWDGSELRPYATIQKGADEAGDAGGGLVAVAAGTYVENLVLDHDHDGVEITGRCRELVTIDGSGAEEPGVDISGGTITIRDLTVAGGNAGLWLIGSGGPGGSARVRLVRVSLDHNRSPGLLVAGSGATVEAEELTVRWTEPSEEGTPGGGVEVWDGAAFSATGLLADGNDYTGLVAANPGTTVELHGARILGTRTRPDGTSGRGINIQDGAALSATDLLLEGNHETGLYASNPGTTVDLQATRILDTQTLPDGTSGRGVEVRDGAALSATDLLLEGNHDTGLVAANPGTTVVLQAARILNTQPLPNGTFGRGVEVRDGAFLSAADLLLEGNHDIGLVAAHSGTTVVLQAARIADTRALPDGTSGRGINIQDGADFSATDLLLEGSHEVGLYAWGAGTTVVLQDARVLDTRFLPDGTKGHGVEVLNGAAFSATDLLLQGNHEAGLLAAIPGTTVVLQGARILDTQPRPDGAGGEGLAVQDGAALSATDLILSGNHNVGLYASDPGTVVDLVNTRVAGTRSSVDLRTGVGLGVQLGASLAATGIEVEGNDGPGAYVFGGAAQLADFFLLGNGFAGAAVLGGALTLEAGAISGSIPHSGAGGGVGVFAWNTDVLADLRVTGVVFSDLPGTALYLRGPGRYVMAGCDVSGTGTWPSLAGGVLAVDGVGPWDPLGGPDGNGPGLLLQGNNFSGLSADAILLDGSSATLAPDSATGEANLFSDLAGEPLFFQRCGEASLPEIQDGSPVDPSCRSGARPLGPLLEYLLQIVETEPVE